MDLRSNLNILGYLICGTALLLLIPAFADSVSGNPDWLVFFQSSVVVCFIGISIVLTSRPGGEIQLSVRGAYLITALSWVVLPIISALPFMGLGISFIDAFFEATSGLTTTGSTVLTDLDHLPPGILLWRALLQWVGGIGILVMAIVMLPFLRVGGSQLFRIESSETSDKVVARSFDLVSNILLTYFGLSALCIAIYYILGMSLFDAICHAFSTLSTGGYSTHDASFGYFESRALHWSGTLFMLSGAVPFFVYIRAMHGNLLSVFNDSQVRVLIGFLAVTSVGLALWLNGQSHIGLGEALTLTSFNITSIVTTTGFATTDYTLWGTGAAGLFFFLMFVGGCSGSTAGGVKIFRFQIIFQLIRMYIRRLIIPNRVTIVQFNGKQIPDDVPIAVLTFLAMFVATCAGCTIILCFMGLDVVTAYSASVTAITNVGPGLGDIVGPAGNFASLPDAAKVLLSAAMIIGRLEVFALLVMFDPSFWEL